jgi:hypothetical protein
MVRPEKIEIENIKERKINETKTWFFEKINKTDNGI